MTFVLDRQRTTTLSAEAQILARLLLPEPLGGGWRIGRLAWGLPWRLFSELQTGGRTWRSWRALPERCQGAVRELIRAQVLLVRPGNPKSAELSGGRHAACLLLDAAEPRVSKAIQAPPRSVR